MEGWEIGDCWFLLILLAGEGRVFEGCINSCPSPPPVVRAVPGGVQLLVYASQEGFTLITEITG
jgi:hypothetical protein